jgi:hypothetical protein
MRAKGQWSPLKRLIANDPNLQSLMLAQARSS